MAHFRKAKGQSCPLVASFNFINLFILIGGANGDEEHIVYICTSWVSNVRSAEVISCFTTA